MVVGRQQTLVQLSDDLVSALDERADMSGRSRSDLIRTAIEQFLRDDIDGGIDEAIVAGYTREPSEPSRRAARALGESIAAEPW